MKPLLRLLDRLRPHFEEGGALHPLHPVFEATENFFFASDRVTPGPPHVRDPLDVKRFMSMVLVALAPATLAGLYFFGLRVLAMIVVSYAVGRCFLALGYPAAMAGNWIQPGAGAAGRLFQYMDGSTTDAITQATPLVGAKAGTFAPLGALFLGQIPGGVGETSALAILLGGAFLLVTKVANWRTVVGALGTFLVLGAALDGLAPAHFGPVRWHLFAGGLLFGAVFMATDPVTSPITGGGKWVYGVLIGALTLLIRNLTGYAEGAMFAILVGNIAAPLFDELVVRWRLRRLGVEG